ncbi:MAG TPA: S53 family serine peptidase [Terracidiphilus sp.]|jgi:subtilase family serine protease
MVRKMGLCLLTVGGILSIATMNFQAQSVLTHHVREVSRNRQAKSLGRLSPAQILQLDIVLPLRDQVGLNTFLKEVYDPASASYRHFLTVSAFTERFGPTEQNYQAVVRFVKSKGFTVIGGSRDRMDVQIKGQVSAIDSAFHLKMRTYQHPTESRTYYAPDREPTTNLKFPLWHISGLDNYSVPHPLFLKKSDYAKAHHMKPEDVVSYATTGSGPSASFLGSDMRAAYYGGTTLTGAGQNLGLFEYAGTDLTDLTAYFTNVGQTNNVPVTLLSTDGTSTSCVDTSTGGNCDDAEQTLDITQAIGMAPGLSSLVVYVGSTDTAIISAMTSNSPLPTAIGCSWGWTPADPTTLDPYFEKMAAQGQTFFAASGDNSTWSSSNEAWPADDANVVSVGGTDLITASAAGPWQSETGWTDSGGGISPDGIAIPSWQQFSGVINSSNQGSTTLRNGPDVSANANFTFYVCADQTTCTANEYGGTSFAAPMWAGYIALVNQQLVANGKSTIGFINPTIYTQNVTSSYGIGFHDITSGTSGNYSAVPGYDLVTGWGSPNGVGLLNSLGSTASASSFGPPGRFQPTPISVASEATTGSPTTASAVASNGFSGIVNLACSIAAVAANDPPTCILTPASLMLSETAAQNFALTVSTTVATSVETRVR